MPLLDHTKLKGYREMRLGYSCLCYITNGYVWQDGNEGVVESLPRQVAIPVTALAGYLGTKPGLGYSSLLLSNWKKIDPNGPMHYSNMDVIIQMTRGPDFLIFFQPPFQAEICAVPGIAACVEALKAVVADDKRTVIKSLQVIKQSLVDMEACFDSFKLLEKDYFFFTFSPLVDGWHQGSTVLPNGLVYEGACIERQAVLPASAGQTSVFYTIDATLGITHKAELQPKLDDLLMTMPYHHREFILAIRRSPSLKNYVEKVNDSDLSQAYTDVVQALVKLRSSHIRLATKFMVIPSKNHEKVQASKKVGGTAKEVAGAIGYLKDVRDGATSLL